MSKDKENKFVDDDIGYWEYIPPENDQPDDKDADKSDDKDTDAQNSQD